MSYYRHTPCLYVCVYHAFLSSAEERMIAAKVLDTAPFFGREKILSRAVQNRQGHLIHSYLHIIPRQHIVLGSKLEEMSRFLTALAASLLLLSAANGMVEPASKIKFDDSITLPGSSGLS